MNPQNLKCIQCIHRSSICCSCLIREQKVVTKGEIISNLDMGGIELKNIFGGTLNVPSPNNVSLGSEEDRCFQWLESFRYRWSESNRTMSAKYCGASKCIAWRRPSWLRFFMQLPCCVLACEIDHHHVKLNYCHHVAILFLFLTRRWSERTSTIWFPDNVMWKWHPNFLLSRHLQLF